MRSSCGRCPFLPIPCSSHLLQARGMEGYLCVTLGHLGAGVTLGLGSFQFIFGLGSPQAWGQIRSEVTSGLGPP